MRSVPFFDDKYPVKTVFTDNRDIRQHDGWDDMSSRNSVLGSCAGVGTGQVVYAKEIHSGSVFSVTDKDGGGMIVHTDESFITKPPGGYDSMITAVPEILMCITTADCLPLFMYDVADHIAAITHCGWRGICSGIASGTVSAAGSCYGSCPENIIAAFGPCICSSCYEVGEELLENFSVRFSSGEIHDFFTPKGNGKYLLDLKKAVTSDLVRAGVLPENIYDTCICSFESEDYASYRRDGKVVRSRQTISGIVLM